MTKSKLKSFKFDSAELFASRAIPWIDIPEEVTCAWPITELTNKRIKSEVKSGFIDSKKNNYTKLINYHIYIK